MVGVLFRLMHLLFVIPASRHGRQRRPRRVKASDRRSPRSRSRSQQDHERRRRRRRSASASGRRSLPRKPRRYASLGSELDRRDVRSGRRRSLGGVGTPVRRQSLGASIEASLGRASLSGRRGRPRRGSIGRDVRAGGGRGSPHRRAPHRRRPGDRYHSGGW